MSATEGEAAPCSHRVLTQPSRDGASTGKGSPQRTGNGVGARGPGMGAPCYSGHSDPRLSRKCACGRARGFRSFTRKPGCAEERSAAATFLAGLLSWVWNEGAAEPRRGHCELASSCADVCVCVCLLLQTRHSHAVQPVARVPVLRPVAVGLITEPEKGG